MWLVKMACHCCYLTLSHGDDPEFRDDQWIGVSLLSTHVGWYNGRLRSRIRGAWQVLRYGAAESFELLSLEETDALISTLTMMRGKAFKLEREAEAEAKAKEETNEI
jgi:hypothetical protein